MTYDLYKTLGVNKKASRAQIRDAYRKKAKESHPDTPTGSDQKFALVKRAHDILSDEDRRAKYDATGDDSEQNPSNELSEAANMLIRIFENVMAQIERKSGDPEEFDVIGDMKISLQAEIDKIQQNKRNIKKARGMVERLIGKFKVKSGENFIELSLKQKLAANDKHMREAEHAEEIAKKAYDVLKLYSFEHRQRSSYGDSSFNMGELMAAAMRY